ncbi:MAG: putative porin [Muribaculaceae bacterium]|nr:putative porin [Muribaculaceae bacterium]
MKKFIKYISIIAIILFFGIYAFAKKTQLEPSYAWTITQPLGERYLSSIDTLQYNYQRQAIPSLYSSAFALTGNLGAEGLNMIFFDRNAMSDFFFSDALEAWMPSGATQKYFNTRIPMTLLSYNTGGGKTNTQDRLAAVFSGNVNKALQIGAAMDYLYSKGSYDYQADKDFTWRAFASYIGDRYEMQAFYNHYNLLNKENGGITDDLYITDPAKVMGGETNVDPKAIPTNLTGGHSHIKGHELYLNQRYKIGYYHHTKDSINDSITSSTYIPVTSFIWTLNFKQEEHLFLNSVVKEDTTFFENSFLSLTGTEDDTKYWKLSNTFGIQLLEGFHKYAKFGLAAYATYEYRKYNQTSDSTLYLENKPEKLTPFPGITVPQSGSQNLLWVGGQLTKQKGSILTYSALAQFGVIGDVAGDIDVSGNISTRFKLFGDSVKITGYGYFKNTAPPYLMNHFISNHFAWSNDFGKTRKFRAGGIINIPHTGTVINAGFETIQNCLYFDKDGNAAQFSDNIQIFSASLKQNLHFKALHWDNEITYQTTSNEAVIPLPKLAIYSNLYLQFKIAKVLNVQLGVDCNYYTRYKAPAYNPATMTFKSQDELLIGNHPFMNIYATCKLKKTRFFVMMSHVNQGWFDTNSFALPHYPLNPRKFQLGISIDFAN